jgi:hypothetical protein
MMRRGSWAALLAGLAFAGSDVAHGVVSRQTGRVAEAVMNLEAVGPNAACAARTAPLSQEVQLRAAAFPGSGGPDAKVHVPAGFDPTRRPGIVLYFHGWRGCVSSSLAPEDVPCQPGGPPRTGSNLAAQIDDAHVNAMLVAVELRIDMPSGEPGALAKPGGLRALLQELLGERLVGDLGCALDVDAIDRVIVVAHSGGYQAAAAALRWGDVPQIVEVALLDALYGARDVFDDWISEGIRRGDSGPRRRRFVDLYTCCGGTADESRALAASATRALHGMDPFPALFDDDGGQEPTPEALSHDLVFAKVPRPHEELPRAYTGAIISAAGFAPLGTTPTQ